MPPKTLSMKKNGECQVHGTPSRTANRTLLFMLLAGFALIVWRVWAVGPSGGKTAPGALEQPFLPLLARELWALLFDRHGIAAELWDVLPYFLAGVLLAGYIRTYKVAVKLQAKLRKYGFLSIFLASLIGLITPLCACGTLTTAISLLFAGVPLAPVMALLVTSPLMSPSTYLLTLNDLGPEWTVIRTLAAFLLGMLAGIVTLLLRDRGFRTDSLFIEGAIPRGDFHDEAYPDERLRCNCKERFGHRVAARTSNMFIVFLAKSSEMLWLVGKYVLVGVAIGAVVERYLPSAWIERLFGRNDPLGIIWITLGSVPIFLHQISASSILYHIKCSLPGTLDGGAALAFLIGGPVTAVPVMVLFWTVFKKRVFALYLFICVLGTILIAYLFQALVFIPGVDMGNPLLKGITSLSGGNSAVLEKRSKQVRIVMDPGGMPLIATYSNDLEGHGNIVFDAGAARLLSDPQEYDNARYLHNTAEWLEQSNASSARQRILVYDTARDPGRNTEASVKGIASGLEKHGFSVMITDRRKTPALSSRLLEGYGQLWVLFSGGVGENVLSDAELQAITRFNGEGRGMMIVAAARNGAPVDLNAVNNISSRYGVHFSGTITRGKELRVARGAGILTKASQLLGRVL